MNYLLKNKPEYRQEIIDSWKNLGLGVYPYSNLAWSTERYIGFDTRNIKLECYAGIYLESNPDLFQEVPNKMELMKKLYELLRH